MRRAARQVEKTALHKGFSGSSADVVDRAAAMITVGGEPSRLVEVQAGSSFGGRSRRTRASFTGILAHARFG
jgi:hypothetical protein